MAKKNSGGVPIKTGGSGAKEVPHGGDKAVGTHKQSEGTVHVGTVPADAKD